MFTRSEYMHSDLSDRSVARGLHRRYYAQFVNDRTITYVIQSIGGNRLLASTDEHLNDIPLKEWDRLSTTGMPLAAKFTDAGDYATLAGLVCVAKEAARQWLEEVPS